MMRWLRGFYEEQIAQNQKKNVWALLLFPAAAIYGLATAGHRLLFKLGILKQVKLPFKVVSVGNLAAGGTGKTPTVIALAEYFCALKKKVVILTRGYGKDEAGLLAMRLPMVPVLAGKNRGAQARAYLAQGKPVDIFLLDDGFQHWALSRALDIVLVNAANPFGNGGLLPAGILREGINALERAQVIVLTHCDEVQEDNLEALKVKCNSVNPGLLFVRSRHHVTALQKAGTEQQRDLEWIRGKDVVAFCGIAYPEGFRKKLITLGVRLQLFHNFGDHAPYGRKQERLLQQWQQQYAEALFVTTEKDFYRNPALFCRLPRLWILKLALIWESGEGQLHEKLDSLFSH